MREVGNVILCLMIWKQYNDELVLVMTNTGSHSDVF